MLEGLRGEESCWRHWPQQGRQEHAPQGFEPHHGADRGRVLLRGRVASLLEVGTGFHPELTAAKTSFLMVRLLGRPTHEEPLRWLFPRGRPAMTMFAGLDVRFKRTAICVDG